MGPGHNATALIKKIILFCFLIGPAPFVDGEEIALSRESLAVMHSAQSDFDAKKYDAAMAKLKEADKMTPDNPFILNMLGAVYTKKKELAAAKSFYDRALAKTPDFFPAQFNVGELLFLERRYPEALKFFRQLQKANPKTEIELLQFKVFLCELQIGNTEKAEKAMRKIWLPTYSPAWYFAMAIWEEKKGNHQKARELVEGARSIFGEKTKMFEDASQDIGLDLR